MPAPVRNHRLFHTGSAFDPGNDLNNEHTTDPDRIFDIAWPHMMFLIYQAGFVELTYQGER